MIQGDIVTNLGSLAYDHSHTMVDEKAPAYGRAGMDLDAGEEAPDMGYQPSQPAQIPVPQPIRDAVNAQRVEAWIAGDNLPSRTRRGVAVKYACDVFTDAFQHKHVWRVASLLLD
jgi:hypothetical protein